MKHLGSSFVLSHFFSFSLCFCCDSCSDADVWTWSLIETWLSSSCPGCVTLISACPCFCCDDAYLGTVTGTRCDPWTASALYVWAAPLRFPQRVCPGRAARLFFCVVSMPSRGPSFEPLCTCCDSVCVFCHVFCPWILSGTVSGGVWSFWEIWTTPCCSFFWSGRPSHCHLPT